MEIKATGLPETIEDYQVALNAAFAGGKAYGLAQRTWVNATTWRGLTGDEDDACACKADAAHEREDTQAWAAVYRRAIEAKLKAKNERKEKNNGS